MTGCGADYDKGYAAYNNGDYATALREFRPLAEQGDARAQVNLGWMYGGGLGVPQDSTTSMKWFTLPAEQGDAKGQLLLGWMYYNGWGVPQDNIYTHMWWNLAASNGNEDGGKMRDNVAKDMTPAQIEKAEKLASECVAKKYKGC